MAQIKITWKLVGLDEPQVMTSAWLSSNGISTEEEHAIVRRHLGDFETEHDAIEASKEIATPEHGFEVIKSFTWK